MRRQFTETGLDALGVSRQVERPQGTDLAVTH
jgi:hypothetical protein